ncbi:MAG: alkaline phosphatase family protein [Alphaproteobacteria bacterium]
MNILFITADQWRGECLSGLGHPHVKTPALDALAADGVSFRRHFAQATPCGPARTCLYTGMYMHNHRSLLNGTPLDTRHTNVAAAARKAGYKPALFGYTDTSLDPRHHKIENGYGGVLPGMDPVCYLDSSSGAWLPRLKEKGYEVPVDPSLIFAPRTNYPGAENKGKTFAPAIYAAEDSNTAFLVDEAINHLSAQGDSPWFVHMSFLCPHPPFVVPEPYHDMYNEKDMPLPVRRKTPEEEASQHPWLEHYLFNQAGTSYTFGSDPRDILTLPDKELRQIKATYYGMMSEVDAQIGRLVNYLKQAELYNNTLIIFTSDHGENLGDHWAFSKFVHFDQTFHIPLIIHDPRPAAQQARGTIIDAFTENIDIMPTILDGIGVDIPMQCDGHSLLPFCRGEHPEGWRQEYHAEFDLRSPYDGEGKPPLGLRVHQCMANVIRGERYKYVHFPTLPPLFFDLKKDPDEFKNLAAESSYQGRVLEYTGKLLSWRMEHDDPALTDVHLTPKGNIRGMRSR